MENKHEISVYIENDFVIIALPDLNGNGYYKLQLTKRDAKTLIGAVATVLEKQEK